MNVGVEKYEILLRNFGDGRHELQDDWARWKWTMKHVLKAHQLEAIVTGVDRKPAIDAAGDAYSKWVIKDAKAVSLIATALGDQVSRIVLTCDSSNEIWTLLCARFERSSKQRLVDSLVEQFYRLQRDESEDMITHISILQKLFMDMNIELRNHNQNELSEIMLTLRIMSTLGKEYNSFRDVWDSLPSEKQTLASLIERLCNIEKRETAAGERVFLARKQKTVAPSKDKKKKERVIDKKKFPCKGCNELGHWIAECPAKTEDQPKTKTAFVAQALSATGCRDISSKFVVDSGATSHLTPRKDYFRSLKMFDRPRKIWLGKKGQFMEAVGIGDIDIEAWCNGEWTEAELLEVWYVPEAGASLLSVKALSKRGKYVYMDENKVSIKTKDGNQLVAEGPVQDGLYFVNFRVKEQMTEAMANLANGGCTLQIYHERLGHQNFRYVKDFLKRLGVHSGVAWSNAARCGSREIGKMRPPSPLSMNESTQNAAPWSCDLVRKSRNRNSAALLSSLD